MLADTDVLSPVLNTSGKCIYIIQHDAVAEIVFLN